MTRRDQSNRTHESLGLTTISACALLLLAAGCGRLADGEDREPFGSGGDQGEVGNGDGSGLGEDPQSGGEISESCYDGVLQPGELCQVQDPEPVDAGVDPCSVSVADFDSDGRPDLAVPNSDPFLTPGGTYVANVLRGHGNGQFSTNEPYDAGAQLPVGLAVGDFDGDGHTDIATANNEAQAAYVLRNMGSQPMGFSDPDAVGVESTASSIEAGDFNGDGADDIVVNTPDGVALLQGGPTGVTWTYTLAVGGGQPMHSTLADLDADGRLDLVAAVSGGFGSEPRLVIFHGGGDGSFPERVEHPLEGDPWWVVAGDINMDGDLDLAVAEYGVNELSILLGNGLGGFSPRTEIDVCLGPQSVAIGDLDNDGASDLVVGCMDGNRVQAWLQVEDGAFELTRWWGTGERPVSVKLADLNLDGQLDIVWANQLSNTVGVVVSHI